jgi:hypothetical protein
MNLIQVERVALSKSRLNHAFGAALDIRKDDMNGYKVGTIYNDGRLQFNGDVAFTPSAMLQLVAFCASIAKLNSKNEVDKPTIS